MGLMFNIYSTWEGKCLHLEDLYVQSNFRQQGIGKALFFATYQVYNSNISS
jgi:GNAT superfamily N-acetyltransferase